MNAKEVLYYIIGILVVVALMVVIVGKIVGKDVAVLGGATHFSGPVDSAAGYTESGVTVIDTDRNIAGASGTFSGTLTVGGQTDINTPIFGGSVYTTTTVASTTLTAAHVCDYSVISLTPTAETIALTLPSTTTLYADCIPTPGDTKYLLLENAATGATSTTIVAGTGITLLEPSGGDVVIQQNEWAWMQFTNMGDDQCAVVVTSIQDAD